MAEREPHAAATLFDALERLVERPRPFERTTVRELWTDPHVSERMLAFHLDDRVDAASYRGAFIDASVAWIDERFGLARGVRVLDAGCGPGLYATRLAERGARVTGVDLSERSIAHARRVATERGLSIDYVVGDYLELDTAQRFDLVLMIMRDYGALSPERRRALLGRFVAVLADGGRVLFDVDSLGALAKREERTSYAPDLMDGFWAPGRYHGFHASFRYDDERVSLDRYTIVEWDRIRTVYSWCQHFSPETLADELEACGLVVEALLGDVAGAPYDPDADQFAVVASRRGTS